MTYSISTSDSAATQRLAARLARSLQGGEVIELISDLGGGKTTFVQGLASGLGYTGEVTSPTFTLSHVYVINPRLELHHYDLYRLGQSGIVGEELAEDLTDPHVVAIIEWAGVAGDYLPSDRLQITLKVTSEDTRELIFVAGGPKSMHLLKGLSK